MKRRAPTAAEPRQLRRAIEASSNAVASGPPRPNRTIAPRDVFLGKTTSENASYPTESNANVYEVEPVEGTFTRTPGAETVVETDLGPEAVVVACSQIGPLPVEGTRVFVWYDRLAHRFWIVGKLPPDAAGDDLDVITGVNNEGSTIRKGWACYVGGGLGAGAAFPGRNDFTTEFTLFNQLYRPPGDPALAPRNYGIALEELTANGGTGKVAMGGLVEVEMMLESPLPSYVPPYLFPDPIPNAGGVVWSSRLVGREINTPFYEPITNIVIYPLADVINAPAIADITPDVPFLVWARLLPPVIEPGAETYELTGGGVNFLPSPGSFATLAKGGAFPSAYAYFFDIVAHTSGSKLVAKRPLVLNVTTSLSIQTTIGANNSAVEVLAQWQAVDGAPTISQIPTRDYAASSRVFTGRRNFSQPAIVELDANESIALYLEETANSGTASGALLGARISFSLITGELS